MKTVYLKEYGIIPNTGEDVTGAIAKMFAENRKNTTFIFEPGRYDFSASKAICADYRLSNSDILPQRKLGLLLKEMENIILDGCGAALMFAGQMQPISMDGCNTITVKNFVIDWDKPLVAEGEIVGKADRYVDIKIDLDIFPCECYDDWLYFDIGDGEDSALCSGLHLGFDPSKHVVPSQNEGCLMPSKVEVLEEGVFRVYSKKQFMKDDGPYLGNTVILRHNHRSHAGIFAEDTKNIILDTITVHSAGGLGVLAQFCENIACYNVRFVPNEKKGRKICSGRDDGFQISNCCGEVVVEGCSFHGLMDDPINVHGTCVSGIALIDNKTIQCRYVHIQAQGFLHWAKEGHQISFINRKNMSSIGVATVASYHLDEFDQFSLTFKEDIPQAVLMLYEAKGVEALALENITNTASFACRNNIFGGSRARGILISTPKPVLIEHNVFDTSGSAILVAGDANGWYESGACHDVMIRNNVFTDRCLSSYYEFCEGMISICPIVPEPVGELPFHKNITIEDNVFYSPEVPILYAFSAENLIFKNNKIFKSRSFSPWHKGNSLYRIEWCNKVQIQNNMVSGDFALSVLESFNSGHVSCE